VTAPRRLVLTGPRMLALEPVEIGPPGPRQVRARGLLSAISHGTELSLYRGTSPFADKTFDKDARLFTDGAGPDYPQALGYEWVGRVEAVGDGVEGFAPGDLVHLRLPHQEAYLVDVDEVAAMGVTGPLPAGLTPDRAAYLSIASIALQAVHDARIRLGDTVAVFGLGALGLLVVQLARLSGAAEVIAFDPDARRRALAQDLDAIVADPMETDPGAVSRAHGPGADVAIEFSGSTAALHQAIRSVRQGGAVVAAGFYQGGAAPLRLGEEFLHNRVTVRASTPAWDNPHRAAPLWDRVRLRQTVERLLADGTLAVDALPMERVPFARAAEVYAALDEGRSTALKTVLVYE